MMSKEIKEIEEFLKNMRPGYTRTVNCNKKKNTQEKNTKDLNNQLNQLNYNN